MRNLCIVLLTTMSWGCGGHSTAGSNAAASGGESGYGGGTGGDTGTGGAPIGDASAGVDSSSGGSSGSGGGPVWPEPAIDAGCLVATLVTGPLTIPIEVAPPPPLDLFIMYDQSGSMNDPLSTTGTKWDAMKSGVGAFVNTSYNVVVSAGLGYYPLDPPPCSAQSSTCTCFSGTTVCYSTDGGSCVVADYAVPDVPIALLPGVASQIVNSLNAHGPGGGSPMRPALEGAYQYAASWASAHPSDKTVVVLTTDGDLTNFCAPNSIQDAANTAAAALASTPSISTFVIGLGASLTALDQIAAAGGTGIALLIDPASPDATQVILDAMSLIVDSARITVPQTIVRSVPCAWQIPTPPNGMPLDPMELNVQAAPLGSSPIAIGAVPTDADCANVDGGWYYDDPINPTTIWMCPQTCDAVMALQSAEIDVLLGCPTVSALAP